MSIHKFLAAVLVKKKSSLKIKKLEFNSYLEKGQVLVKIFYSGICGKQIDEINGVGAIDKYIPHCLGHEASGKVIKVGPGVKNVKVGKNVVLHWLKGKGINSNTPKYRVSGTKKIINAGWVTTFNNYAVVSENRLTILPSGINLKDAALFGCAIPTGVGAILNYKNFKNKTDYVGVVGCGGVGLLMIMTLRFLKFKNIVAIDIRDKSLSVAKKFGAKYCLKFNNNLTIFKNRVLSISNNKGLSHIFCNIGDDKTIGISISCLSNDGHLVQVGVPKNKSSVKVNFFDVLHGKKISGSMGGYTNISRDMKKYFQLYKSKKFNFSKLISKTFPFNKINKAIEYHKKYGGRVIIKF